VLTCPLLAHAWFRVVLDEAQMVEGTTTAVAIDEGGAVTTPHLAVFYACFSYEWFVQQSYSK
jgi:hypothetical protein